MLIKITTRQTEIKYLHHNINSSIVKALLAYRTCWINQQVFQTLSPEIRRQWSVTPASCTCTSSASCWSFSTQISMFDRVSEISLASSLIRLAASRMEDKALSRSFLIWMSRDVRLEQPSSSGVGKLKKSTQTDTSFTAVKIKIH